MDISNGEGLGVTLFVQGCHFHCKDCFNSETWDFDGGKEFTDREEEIVMHLSDHYFIKRLSILGGEPLEPINIKDLYNFISKFKAKFPDKKIWLYTGYRFESLIDRIKLADFSDDLDVDDGLLYDLLFNYVDILVDGLYIHAKRDLKLKFRGSSNQRIIMVKDSLKENKVILREDLM
jgi:anaerobic ribonucleoside-triphosphate reductase activating protein